MLYMQPKKYQHNQTVFNENEAAEDIFFIQKGEVKLSKRIIEGEPDRVNKQRVSKNNFV